VTKEGEKRSAPGRQSQEKEEKDGRLTFKFRIHQKKGQTILPSTGTEGEEKINERRDRQGRGKRSSPPARAGFIKRRGEKKDVLNKSGGRDQPFRNRKIEFPYLQGEEEKRDLKRS